MVKAARSKANASPRLVVAELKAEMASTKASAMPKMEAEETSAAPLSLRTRAKSLEGLVAKLRRERFPDINDYEYHIKVAQGSTLYHAIDHEWVGRL